MKRNLWPCMARRRTPATTTWIACECDSTPCVCYQPVPRIGPIDPAEARQLQQDLSATFGATADWLVAYIETHADELAKALSKPVEQLLAEVLASRDEAGAGG